MPVTGIIRYIGYLPYIMEMGDIVAKGTVLTYRLYPVAMPWDCHPSSIKVIGNTVTHIADSVLLANIKGQWHKQVQDKGLPIYDLPKGTLCTYGYQPYITHKVHRVYVSYDSPCPYEEYHDKEDGMLEVTYNAWTGPEMDLSLWGNDYDEAIIDARDRVADTLSA